MMAAATVLYVAYGVTDLDLAWIPDEVTVVVVHNDDRLPEERCRHRRVVHLRPNRNLGFGAAVNEALWSVDTDRVILVNPDTSLDEIHFRALTDARPDEIVTIPLIEEDGSPNAVVSPYWGAMTFVATALRLGRFAPRHGRLRVFVSRLLGSWGSGHRDALDHRTGTWSVTDRWATGAVLSLPLEAIMAVGGFDEQYFLYFEDADLHQRLAALFPEMKVRLADVPPAVHRVGGCAQDRAEAVTVASHRCRSAITYSTRQPGIRWRLAHALVVRRVR